MTAGGADDEDEAEEDGASPGEELLDDYLCAKMHLVSEAETSVLGEAGMRGGEDEGGRVLVEAGMCPLLGSGQGREGIFLGQGSAVATYGNMTSPCHQSSRPFPQSDIPSGPRPLTRPPPLRP